MTALSSTQVNEVLDRYNPAQRFDVLRGFLKQKRSYQERTLRSHSDPIKEEDEIEVRYNLDELLEMAGAIEIVALATGALPELEAEFQTQMLSILCNDAIRNYYSAIYPLPLPILLRHQLTDPKSNTSAWSPIQRACSDRKNESFAFLLTFFELETRRRRSRVLELFFDLLDAYVINHAFSMADLLKILGDKKKLEKIMHNGSQRTNMDARALRGLNQFIIFCADLDDLCDRCSDQPIVRAAIFLHFCYWFRARGHYLRKTTSILEKRLKRLTSTIKSARLNDAPHQAHAQPDASASFFGERVDGFGQLIDKLTDWEPYARPLIVAASPLLDAWARPQAGHAP